MRRALLLLPAILCLAAPAGASAGTVSVVNVQEADGRSPGESSVRYAAAPGEVNNLTLQPAPGEDLLVIDTVGVTPGTGCTRPVPGDTTRALCSPQYGFAFAAELGDGNDTAVATPGQTGRIAGGPGNDNLRAPQLLGGPGDDVLTAAEYIKGGPGNDLMTGVRAPLGSSGVTFDESDARNGSDTMRGQSEGNAFGGDTVSYEGRNQAIRADVTGDRDDGAAGERDQIASSVESITGGKRNDVLRGDGGPNRLTGGGGSDALYGGAGDDELTVSGRSRNRLSGGRGEDTLVGGDGPDRLSPGPGFDTVTARGGADLVRASDALLDRISCGGGRDRLSLDRFDFYGKGCERARRPGLAAALPLGLSVAGTGDLASAEIGCPGDGPRVCRGTLTTSYRGKRLSRKRFSVRRGTTRNFDVLGGRRSLVGKQVRLQVRSGDRRGRIHRYTLTATVPADDS